jgi:hypothetical protein
MKLSLRSFFLAFLISALFASVPGRASENDYVQTVVTQLKDALRPIPNAHVTTIGNVVLIAGEISEPAQMDEIARLTQALKGLHSPEGDILVRNTTTISDSAKRDLANSIAKEIGVGTLHARFIHDTLFIYGMAENDFQADRAVEIARAFFRHDENGWNHVALNEPTEAQAASPKPVVADNSPIWWHITIVDLMRIHRKNTVKSEVAEE